MEMWEEGKVSSGGHLNLLLYGEPQAIVVVFGVHMMRLPFPLGIALRLANDTQMLAIWGHI